MLVDAVVPAASELVMVYGGALASGAIGGEHIVLFGNRIDDHTAGYLAIAATGTLGYVAGAWAGWLIGARAGRPFVERHASAFHLDPRKLGRADAWFGRYGALAVLVGRIIPVVRSFVSIPAGFERMPLAPYTLLTLAGSAVWSFALGGVGWAIGTGYQRFHHAFDDVSIAVAALAVTAIGLLAYRHRRIPQAEPSVDET